MEIFLNEFDKTIYVAIAASIVYFIRWIIKKIAVMIGREMRGCIVDVVNDKIKPVESIATSNSEKLVKLEHFQNDIYKKFREVKHEIKNNAESSINHQVLDSINNLQHHINQLNKNEK